VTSREIHTTSILTSEIYVAYSMTATLLFFRTPSAAYISPSTTILYSSDPIVR